MARVREQGLLDRSVLQIVRQRVAVQLDHGLVLVRGLLGDGGLSPVTEGDGIQGAHALRGHEHRHVVAADRAVQPEPQDGVALSGLDVVDLPAQRGGQLR